MKMCKWIAACCVLAGLTGCPSTPAGVPTASFTSAPDHGTKPLTVTFTDTSTPGDSPITAWAWEFGDDGTSIEQNPVHQYTVNGVFDVKLTVTNTQGSNATLSTAAVVVGNVWAAKDGNANDERVTAVAAAGSTDVLILSTATQDGHDNTDMKLQRRDASGVVLWTEYYGGADDETAGGIVYDGGDILICGSTKSYGLGGSDAYVLRLDSNGVEQWSKTYGTLLDDTAEKIIATSGGFVFAGSSIPLGRPVADVYLVKIDDTGKQLWSKTYGSSTNTLAKELAHGIRETTDHGFIVVGEQVTASADFYVVRTDDTGKELWSGNYGSVGGTDRAYDAFQIGENYTVIGTGYSETITAYDIMLLKLDKDGKKTGTVFAGTIGSDEGIAAVAVGGNFIVAGSTNSATSGGRDIYLASLKPDGTKNWTKVFGGVGEERAFAMASLGGDLLIGGTTTSFGAGGVDNYILRTNSTGYGPEIPDPAL